MHTKLYISTIMHLMHGENKPQHTQNTPLVRQLLCDCAPMFDIYIYSGPSIIWPLINRTFGYPNCSDDCSIRVFYNKVCILLE